MLTIRARIRQADVTGGSKDIPRYCQVREAPCRRPRQRHVRANVDRAGLCCASSGRLSMSRLLFNRLHADTPHLPPCFLHPMCGQAAAPPRDPLPTLQIRYSHVCHPWYEKAQPTHYDARFRLCKLTRRRQPRPKASEFHEEVLSQGDQGKTESQRR